MTSWEPPPTAARSKHCNETTRPMYTSASEIVKRAVDECTVDDHIYVVETVAQGTAMPTATGRPANVGPTKSSVGTRGHHGVGRESQRLKNRGGGVLLDLLTQLLPWRA